jgi:hypothetical protein
MEAGRAEQHVAKSVFGVVEDCLGATTVAASIAMEKDIRYRNTLIALGALIAASAVAYRLSQSTAPVQAGDRVVRLSTESARTVEEPAAPRLPLAYYTQTVKQDLLSGPAPVAVAPAPRPARPRVAAPEPPPAPAVAPPRAAEPPPPAPAVRTEAYTGTVTVRGETLALIEDRQTGVGRYVRVGDPLSGGSVSAIGRDSVTIRTDAGDVRLRKNQEYSLVPLNRSADFLTARPAAPAPGTPAAANATPAAGAPTTAPAQERGRRRWRGNPVDGTAAPSVNAPAGPVLVPVVPPSPPVAVPETAPPPVPSPRSEAPLAPSPLHSP